MLESLERLDMLPSGTISMRVLCFRRLALYTEDRSPQEDPACTTLPPQKEAVAHRQRVGQLCPALSCHINTKDRHWLRLFLILVWLLSVVFGCKSAVHEPEKQRMRQGVSVLLPVQLQYSLDIVDLMPTHLYALSL